MEDRKFKKSTVFELLEGDITNANPDGDLNRDKPLYKIIGIRLLTEGVKRIEIEIQFDSDQGNLTVRDSRFLTFNYNSLPAGVKTVVKDFYNYIVDKVNNLPQFDGVEQ